MLAKKHIGMIAGGAAATIAIVLIAIYSSYGSQPSLQTAPVQNTAPDTSNMQGPIISQDAGTYKINTECELIYSIAYGQYPNGDKIPGVKVESLLNNYPEEFKAWKDILQNPDNRTAFFSKPLPEEFRSVLTIALMKETSINPKLEQVAGIVTDPQGKAKLQQAFQEFSCQKYFDERQKKTTSAP